MRMVVCSDAMLNGLARPRLTMSTGMTSARTTQIMAKVIAWGRNEKVTRQIIPWTMRK